SKLLKSWNTYNGVRRWVNDMTKFHALLSGMLSIIHLHMYAAGHEVLIHLNNIAKQQEDMDMGLILPIWNSVYNSMLIMVNHATPYHTDITDINGWEPWLDMLITVGDYRPLDFIVPTLELHLEYNPGMVIAMSGSTLEHGVGYSDGDCACLAYYMQQNVHQLVGIPLCDVPHILDLQL
ncbi:hypothetical protein PISMIDRAFT_101035, partial [Pisolithus microcarpus 441]